MATYTPTLLKAAAQLTASAATVYTPSGSNVGIIRTIQASCAAGGHSFTLSNGSDAAATRLFAAYPLTANVPAIFNGWWVVPNGTNVQAFADAATQVTLELSGYEYG